jgi:hypothetical protein
MNEDKPFYADIDIFSIHTLHLQLQSNLDKIILLALGDTCIFEKVDKLMRILFAILIINFIDFSVERVSHLLVFLRTNVQFN